MKKVFLSLPMSGRTQENIEFTIKAMTKKAKEILGEDIEVSHLADLKKYDNMDILANPGMFNMVHATSKMVDCDYFMGFSRAALNLLGTVTHSKHQGCTMEEELWLYSQRHENVKMIKLNDHIISCKILLMIGPYNIQEFVPEIDWKTMQEEIMKASRATIENMDDWKFKKAESIKKNQKILENNKRLIIPRRNSKSLLVNRLNDIDKEANNGKEENN